jgi:glutamyl-tRNA synthetase
LFRLANSGSVRMSVRTRFAPSPTGYLHIGGVRTALFNWLYARQHGGQFLLRIDDTDAQRNVEEALAPILAGFRWLGIDWDEGPEVGGPHAPYFQSQRSAHYQAAVEALLRSGAAYRDFARPEELTAEREEAEREKRPFLYSRRWRAESEADVARFTAEGRAGVVRLNMPRAGQCQFHDQVRGPCVFDWDKEQDHVIQRADGTCLYHLASVVDDHDFQITHVIRAVEHLSNTPRQIFIAQALGYPLPEYAHLPYVAEPGSQNKLSKRKIAQYLKNADFKRLYDHALEIVQRLGVTPSAETFNPVIVDFYREAGYLPDAIINYLMLLGWSLDDKTEDFTREEMIQYFSLGRVTKAPASFDGKKLWAFEDRHMQRLPVKQRVAKMLPFLQRAGLVATPAPCEVGPKLARIVEAAGDRLKLCGDILNYADFFFLADDAITYDAGDFAKRIQPAAGQALLAKFADELRIVSPFEVEPLETMMKAFVEREQVKLADVVHPVRVAISGKGVGPGLYDCLALLGREACLKRIERALAAAQANSV